MSQITVMKTTTGVSDPQIPGDRISQKLDIQDESQIRMGHYKHDSPSHTFKIHFYFGGGEAIKGRKKTRLTQWEKEDVKIRKGGKARGHNGAMRKVPDDQRPFMLLDYCCRCFGLTLIKRHGPLSLKTTPSDTLVVLQNLLMCMVCFYSLYYIVVSVCIGLLRVHEINSLLAPFDYTTQPSWQNPKYLVGVISTEVTYVLGGLVFAWIVEEWVWDYAITVTLLHVAMTVAVMSDFPSAEHWWIALGSGLVMMIFGGQLMAHKLFRSNFVYPAELQNF